MNIIFYATIATLLVVIMLLNDDIQDLANIYLPSQIWEYKTRSLVAFQGCKYNAPVIKDLSTLLSSPSDISFDTDSLYPQHGSFCCQPFAREQLLQSISTYISRISSIEAETQHRHRNLLLPLRTKRVFPVVLSLNGPVGTGKTYIGKALTRINLNSMYVSMTEVLAEIPSHGEYTTYSGFVCHEIVTRLSSCRQGVFVLDDINHGQDMQCIEQLITNHHSEVDTSLALFVVISRFGEHHISRYVSQKLVSADITGSMNSELVARDVRVHSAALATVLKEYRDETRSVTNNNNTSLSSSLKYTNLLRTAIFIPFLPVTRVRCVECMQVALDRLRSQLVSNLGTEAILVMTGREIGRMIRQDVGSTYSAVLSRIGYMWVVMKSLVASTTHTLLIDDDEDHKRSNNHTNIEYWDNVQINTLLNDLTFLDGASEIQAPGSYDCAVFRHALTTTSFIDIAGMDVDHVVFQDNVGDDQHQYGRYYLTRHNTTTDKDDLFSISGCKQIDELVNERFRNLIILSQTHRIVLHYNLTYTVE